MSETAVPRLPRGSYPVMLTAFDQHGRLDPAGNAALVEWYLGAGSAGLFTNSRSSEFEFLELPERLELARLVVSSVRGRVPVVSTGSVAGTVAEQIDAINAMASTGVAAVVLITNHLGSQTASNDQIIERLDRILDGTEADLGFYECPTPWKRLLDDEVIAWMAASGRFSFGKDTSHDQGVIATRVKITAGSRLAIYNAQTSSILEGMGLGAAGHSGIGSNLHPEVVAWLCDRPGSPSSVDQALQDLVAMGEAMLGGAYPLSAKQYARDVHRVRLRTVSRMTSAAPLDDHGQRPFRALSRQVSALWPTTHD